MIFNKNIHYVYMFVEITLYKPWHIPLNYVVKGETKGITVIYKTNMGIDVSLSIK